MRVLICGGRDFSDRALMSQTLARFKPEPIATGVSDAILIVGGAQGADKLAEEWADVFGVRKRVYPADWERHGRRAGPIRNQRMIDEGKPDLVIGFPGTLGESNEDRS